MNKRNTLLRAALIGVITATAACSMERAPRAQVDDAALATRVSSRLAADPDVSKIEIDVDVLDQVVTMRGIVDNETERQEAERVAEGTPGVDRVRNLIELESEVQDDEKNDLMTRVKVGTQLAADPDVRRTDIDIDVEEGTVTLSGVVEDEEARKEAIRIAKSVEGVKEVRNELRLAQLDE
jgi:hyperosmotically inducible protein